MLEDNEPVVIDNGTDTTKAGFAGEDSPRAIFPSVVGYPQKGTLSQDIKDHYVGDDARAKRGLYRLNLVPGSDFGWEDRKRLWGHVYEREVRTPSCEQPTLLTAPPDEPDSGLDKMAQIFFEDFNVPALLIHPDSSLALYASGRTTGCVLDMGASGCRATPVYEGSTLGHNTLKNTITSRTLALRLERMLGQRGYHFLTPTSRDESIYHMVSSMCYIALDPVAEAAKPPEQYEKEYDFLSSNVLFSTERFLCPEILFNPSLDLPEWDSPTQKGIADLICDSVHMCPDLIRDELTRNVVLSGGPSMFPGLAERLPSALQSTFDNYQPVEQVTKLEALYSEKSNLLSKLPKELKEVTKQYTSKAHRVRVVAPPERKYSTWIGGSIVASLSSVQWITKEQYNESGPRVIRATFC